jgi:AcrR family transcriptional regulator
MYNGTMKKIQVLLDTFIALRRAAGEVTEGFTLEAFEDTLRHHATRLERENPNTKAVFSCVLEGGRAALKVTLVPTLKHHSDICW